MSKLVRLTAFRPTAFGAILLALVLPIAAMASASAQNLGGSDGKPLDIASDNAVEWHQDEAAYVARGHARAQRGDSAIEADVLTAFYREDASRKKQIYQIVAEGNVRLLGPDRQAFGAHGIYDVDRKIMVLTGGDLKIVTRTDVVTARDALEYYEDRNLLVARGDAVATKGTDRLRADVLIGQFVKEPGGASRLTRIDGAGAVVVTTATDVATGSKLVYALDDDVAVLMGNVRITRGQDQIGGEAAEMNMKTKVNRVIAAREAGGRVHALLIPESGKPPAAR